MPGDLQQFAPSYAKGKWKSWDLNQVLLSAPKPASIASTCHSLLLRRAEGSCVVWVQGTEQLWPLVSESFCVSFSPWIVTEPLTGPSTPTELTAPCSDYASSC